MLKSVVNKIQIYFTGIILLSAVFGCKPRAERIRETLIYSDDHVEIIRVCNEIIENNVLDTSLIRPLLTHIIDMRISDSFYYLGQGVYSARLKALSFITAHECNYSKEQFPEIDLKVIDCYLDYAVKNGSIQSSSEINLIHPYIKKITSFDSYKESILNTDQVDWFEKYRWPDPPPYGVLHN